MLLAYNEKVQEYNAAPDRTYKKNRLASLMNAVQSAGHVFERLFTFAKKHVLDEIIYLLSGSGICKIGGEALAKKCGVSIRTVRAAVAAMKKTGEFEVGRLATDHAGKYIFVDKAHENYEWIMHDVFGVEIANAPLSARQDAPLQNAESLAGVGVEGENDALNGFNSLNLLKPAIKNNNITDEMATETGGKEGEQERKSLETFAEPSQLAFYDAIKKDAELSDRIKDEAYGLALALGDAERIDVELALDKVRRIHADMQSHLWIETSVRAVFARSYREALTYKPLKEARKVPAFLNYDWTRKPVENVTRLVSFDWL